MFVTSIIRRRNVRAPKTTRAAKFNFPTRLCNSRFVIDRLSKVSLNNCRSSHSLLSGKQSCLSTVSISIPEKVNRCVEATAFSQFMLKPSSVKSLISS